MKTARAKDIFQAAAFNSTPVVKYFVEQEGFQITKTNSKNQTVAHIAAENCNIDMLKYLLSVNDSVLRVVDNFGNSVFQVAVENGALDIVKHLVHQYRADIHQKNERLFANTPIHLAAEEGQLEVLKYFIEEKHVDVNVRNEVGEPPVFLAAERKQMDTLKYLVEKAKADVLTLDCKNDNILFISAKVGDLKVPKYLLDERKVQLDINWRNEDGFTVVFLATRFDNIDVLKYFVEEKHADVNIPDNEGQTPLHEAARLKSFAIVTYLVSKGANTELMNNRNKTAAQVAKDPDITRYLKEKLRQRSRRSPFQSSISCYPPPSTSMLTQYTRQIIGRTQSESFVRINGVSQFNSFLECVIASLRYVKSYHYSKYPHEPLLSAQQIILSKMNPLVIEAVMNFEET